MVRALARPSACVSTARSASRTQRLRTRPHEPKELAHYARAAVDIEYQFPFGWQEIEGIHDRGDWDLSRHGEFSGKDLGITDPETKEHYVPMVIETSVGVDRTCLALLCDAWREEELEGGETRVVLGFAPALAPLKVAVLPLSKKLAEPAEALARASAPALERLLRRRRQHRPALPPHGRGRDAVVCHGRLRDRERRQGHRARARLDGAGADRRSTPWRPGSPLRLEPA